MYTLKNAIEFYDHIIRKHTIRNSRKFCITNNIYRIQYISHNDIQFKFQINNYIHLKLLIKVTRQLSYIGWDKIRVTNEFTGH